MQDKIELFGNGSIIQHGKLNERVYLIKLVSEDFPEIIDYINKLARDSLYTKIFCKIPGWAAPDFFSDGFILEAQIPDFYNYKTDAFFMSKFLNSDRLLGIEYDKLKELSKILKDNTQKKSQPSLEKGLKIRKLEENNVAQICNIYKQVFKTYPFPIHNEKYILNTMKEGVHYFGVERKNQLLALSSAEVDLKGQNAEMTDFATPIDFRGKKLSILLLKYMEKAMKKIGIKTVYTIARLNSIPMNKTFFNCNYKYAGTLINNTNIAGSIESMNVLYKYL